MPKKRLTKPRKVDIRTVVKSTREDTTSHLIDPGREKPKRRKSK